MPRNVTLLQALQESAHIEREATVRNLTRWWETLGRPERIVALSIGLAAPIAIINSTVWAIAVCYMAHERARVEIERLRAHAAEQTPDSWQSASTTPTSAHTTDRSH